MRCQECMQPTRTPARRTTCRRRWKDSSDDGDAPSPVRNSLSRPTIACSVGGPSGFVGILLPTASALIAGRFWDRWRPLRFFLGLLLCLLFLGGELFSLVLFPRGFVSHVSAPAAREIGVATETNARTDRRWAPRHSDRPVKAILLRQAARISTEKSTRRLADPPSLRSSGSPCLITMTGCPAGSVISQFTTSHSMDSPKFLGYLYALYGPRSLKQTSDRAARTPYRTQ